MRGLFGGADAGDVLEPCGQAVGTPELPVEEPAKLAGGDGRGVEGEVGGGVVPGPARPRLLGVVDMEGVTAGGGAGAEGGLEVV